jgi:hypothetical protein
MVGSKDAEKVLRKVRESLSPRGSPSQGPTSFGSNPPTPPFPVEPLEITATPIEGKPGFYVIDGLEFGPDSSFSDGHRMKGRPYLRARAYVIAEYRRTHGQLVCEIIPGKEHYLPENMVEVHHTKKKDFHVARHLAPACHRHNAMHGPPKGQRPSESIEREKVPRGEPDTLTPGQVTAAPAVLKLNIDLYPVFCRYLRDRISQAPRHELDAKSFILEAAKHMRKQTGHGSPQAATNYLNMETSTEGDYDVIEGVIRKREREKKAETKQEELQGA